MAKPVFKSTSRKEGGVNAFTAELPAGAFVFREGDLGTEMYILQEGRVEILKRLKGEEQQLAVLEKGDFFGEMSLLEDLPRTASARCLEDCRVIKINGSTFDQMLRSKPEIAVRIMRKLSRRLRQADEMLQEALGGEQADGSGAPEVPSPTQSSGEPAPQKLVHLDTGIEYHLGTGTETLVGRRDPVTGILPEVDLTAADTQRSTSRRHAKIERRDGRFYVVEEIGTMNGTFVNGEQITTGVPVEIRAGDEVQFGLVKLLFRDAP